MILCLPLFIFAKIIERQVVFLPDVSSCKYRIVIVIQLYLVTKPGEFVFVGGGFLEHYIHIGLFSRREVFPSLLDCPGWVKLSTTCPENPSCVGFTAC